MPEGAFEVNMLTFNEVSSLLEYNPDTGILRWKVNVSRKMRAGSQAGANCRGYIRLKINQRPYAAHRVAWLLMHGRWPRGQVDHINGIRDDNRWSNLRECNNAENHQNLPRLVTNKSGFPGVSWQAATGKWQAHITVNRRSRHLGLFGSPEEAAAAYAEAKSELHTFQPIARAS